jgi:hypothetical protein
MVVFAHSEFLKFVWKPSIDIMMHFSTNPVCQRILLCVALAWEGGIHLGQEN